MTAIHDYILKYPHLLKQRDMLLDLFSEVEFPKVDENSIVTVEGAVYPGKLVHTDKGLQGIVSWDRQFETQYKINDLDDMVISIPTKDNPTLIYVTEPITIPKNTFPNLSETITSTFGRMVVNYLLLVDPFHDIFPYWNTPWSMKALTSMVINAALEKYITTDQLDVYIQNLYFFGHSSELAVPNYTKKSLTTDPSIREKRQELMKLHQEALENNNPVVMAQIEDALIEIDKKHLEGDPSMDYYGMNENKSFGIHRKKMFLTSGMAEEFGNKGSFNYVENPLNEGWEKKNFSVICNDIRKGIYERASETANGGEESKFIGRVFQNTRISSDDCETPRTLETYIDPNEPDKYLFRNIRLKDGSLKTITKDTLPSYVGNTVNMRSPMYCEAKPGYCKICMGKLFEELDQNSLTMVTLEIGSYFLTLSLKGFHGSKLSTTEIKSLNEFVI